jgi:serine/threonine-protein kinase HipA
MDEDGSWRVFPAYGLTFSSGPGGEHCTSVMVEGRASTQSHLLKLTRTVGVSDNTARKIIEEING